MIKREAKVDRQTAAGSVPQNTKSDRQITGGAKKSWKRFLPARTEKLKEGFRPSRNIAEYMSQLPSRSIVLQNRKKRKKEYLLVDGYNIIFAWEELKELSKINIDSARDRLKDILCNYQGYRKCTLILVFDAYRVKGHREEITKYHNIHVVYTKEAETADMFIEKTVHAIGRKYQVTVATSDGLEQVIIMGQGGKRLSAPDSKKKSIWRQLR